MKKTTNKYLPEVRESALRMVLDNQSQDESRWAAIIKPSLLISNLPHFFAYLGIVRRTDTNDSLGVDTNLFTRMILRDVIISHRPERSVPPLSGCRQLFPRRSSRTKLSNI